MGSGPITPPGGGPPRTNKSRTQEVSQPPKPARPQKTADAESKSGASKKQGSPSEPERRAHGSVMEARVKSGVDVRKGFEMVEKSHTVTDAVLQGGREVMESRATRALGDLQDAQQELTNIERRMKQVGAAMAKIDKPGELGQFTKLSEEMGELSRARDAVSGKIGKAESALDGLRKELKAGDKLASTSAKISEGLEKAKGLKQLSGKVLFGLDVLGKYQEFAKKDPANAGKNMTKAVTAAAAGLGDLGLSRTTSASEAAVAILKFGLETAGMQNTDTFKAVDLASQAFPGDIMSKGLEHAIELGYAGLETLQTGGIKRFEALNTANLKGDNGAVIQGMAILGEVAADIAAGDGKIGRNIPIDDKSLYFKDLFQGLLTERGTESVSAGQTGRGVGEKRALLGRLMQGSKTPGDDVMKIQEVISKGDPKDIAGALGATPTRDLVASLHEYNGQHSDPLANTVNDLMDVARNANDPAVKAQIYDKALGLLAYGIAQGRSKRVGEVKAGLDARPSGAIPADIRARFERLVRQAD